MKAVKRPWWSYIFCCCWHSPPQVQKQSGVLRYRAHLYKTHGKNAVRMAYGVCDVDLDDKVNKRQSLSVREIMRLEHTLDAMKKFDLRFHRGGEFVSPESDASGEEAIEENSTPDITPPGSPKKKHHVRKVKEKI